VNKLGEIIKDTIVSLPDFASSEQLSESFESYDRERLFSLLPKNESLFYLESGPCGRTILLLGEKWSIDIYAFKVEIKTEEKIESFDREGMTQVEILNSIEVWLQNQDDCLLGTSLMYEAGWDGEKRKASINRRLPDITIVCPQEVVIQDGDATVSYRDKSIKSLLKKNNHSYTENFSKDCMIKNTLSEENYLKCISRIKDKIRSGHSFQVNFSQAFEMVGEIDLLSWAKSLFENEAGHFSCLVIRNDYSILSISPERLVAKKSNTLITRPIAGTFAKSESMHDIEKALNEFRNHPKELAEHNMLIDLERNDLGKVSEAGSVYVHEYLCIEELPHLYHLVSEVRSKIQEGKGIGDVIQAMFPGGTITGCPKLETMFILNELEQSDRKAYTGSVGYIGKNESDLNILIRTALIEGNKVTMRFGGGIVWDSKPEKEYKESLVKARGLILSLIKGGAFCDFDHRSLRQFFS